MLSIGRAGLACSLAEGTPCWERREVRHPLPNLYPSSVALVISHPAGYRLMPCRVRRERRKGSSCTINTQFPWAQEEPRALCGVVLSSPSLSSSPSDGTQTQTCWIIDSAQQEQSGVYGDTKFTERDDVPHLAPSLNSSC